jgi:TRAP-type mannitol/chloroaromatic compound transport system permease large subunit
MGAVGAMIMAMVRGRLDYKRVREALESTAKLSVFVMFILIGATVFSFTFTAVDGKEWIEHLFDKLPGGQIGFLIFVNAMIFFLGFFLDFFEIAFILIPLLAPVAVNLNIDLIWFGILIALNLQTSFLTPPFGFALFYLRSVSPVSAFVDRVTKKRIEGVRTIDIYRGSIPFVLIQILILACSSRFPVWSREVSVQAIEVDLDTIEIPRATDDAGWGGGGGAWD